jgi:kinesin family protein 11
VLKGFNCTIFAYGQTGTGKTYTMSGDISDHLILPDDAGIIPRVLHFLFHNLGARSDTSSSSNTSDSSVKISFIELYNEELRDLLSADHKSNLKIFDGDSRRGAATVVQGMKEQYITSTKTGIQLLRNGSHKRQVAATKCNDLSSRSHTIFTITVYTKRTTASGEEIISSGKLNLVDLAGSENIGRSGAENKRAVEAVLINKSLLTLGRVINALVDRSPHIPYRESKLTRLLQDSLGGRTKTCIIATVSPARSNLEETTSTLDYAFRAKNIQNKPQVNNFVPRKALLKDMAAEIEKLESELTASRLRNGVYLTNEAYEELKNENESQRTLIKEEREKIEMIDSKLFRKGQDLLELSSNFDILKKDSEAVKDMLDKEIVLRHQHERTEQELMDLNRRLVTTLDQSTSDVTGLHLKVQRQSELHSRNKGKYGGTKRDVADTTTLVEDRIAAFQIEQQGLLDGLSRRMDEFLKRELDEFDKSKSELEKNSIAFEQSQTEVVAQTTKSENELKKILGGAKMLQEALKDKIGTGLSGLSLATRRISDGIMSEVKNLQAQLQLSYTSFSMDFKTTFDDMSKELREQQEEMQRLWDDMAQANRQLEGSQSQSLNTLSDLVDKERVVRDQEYKNLMLRIQELVDVNMLQQESRLGTIAAVSAELRSAGQDHSAAGVSFNNGNEQFRGQSREFGDRLVNFRDMMKTRFQHDYAVSCLPRGTDTTRAILTQFRLQTSTQKT